MHVGARDRGKGRGRRLTAGGWQGVGRGDMKGRRRGDMKGRRGGD